MPSDDEFGVEDLVPCYFSTSSQSAGEGAKCNLCGKFLSTHYSMRRHLQNVHMMVDKIKCSLCGKLLKNKDALKEHQRYMHSLYQRKRL